MIPYMVGKLAPNSSHLTRGLVKYVPGRGYFCAVFSQNGDKFVTSPPPPIVERVEPAMYLPKICLRHPLADEFAQFAWSVDFGLTTPSVVAKPLYILCDRRNVTLATGVPKWGYHGKYQNGKPSQWMAETEILSSFNSLQLDVFQALWNLYNPHLPQVQQNSSRKRSQFLPCEDALRLFPIGTTDVKESGSKTLSGQVYDYRFPCWRVQYEDNDWEELSPQEVHRMARSTP